MQVFINECSLIRQYKDNYEFYDSIKQFISSVKLLSDLDVEKYFFKSTLFFERQGVKGVHFQTSLKSNFEINSVFIENWQRINLKIWEKSQVHDKTSSYVYIDKEYCTTSVAELTERKNNKEIKGFLLNFKNSNFKKLESFNVVKNNSQNVKVNCAFDSISVYNWLIENEFIIPSEIYNVDSKLPPTDSQSVLKDTRKFELTTYIKNQGRKVYRRIKTDELWVIDNYHYGSTSHCEVFNEISKKHIGTSLYNKIQVEEKYRKNDRTINLG